MIPKSVANYLVHVTGATVHEASPEYTALWAADMNSSCLVAESDELGKVWVLFGDQKLTVDDDTPSDALEPVIHHLGVSFDADAAQRIREAATSFLDTLDTYKSLGFTADDFRRSLGGAVPFLFAL